MFSKVLLFQNLFIRRNLLRTAMKSISFKFTSKSSIFTQQSVKSFSTAQQPSSIKVIQTVADHKPPFHEDTIGGRYASTLFVAGSKAKELYKIYEDMKYISTLYSQVESFRIFADNAGLNNSQINDFVNEMSKCGEFCETTLKFCDLIGKNKRFMYINEIAKKYQKLYLLLTKEEKITIYSATPLSTEQRNSVDQALKANPENEGKTFIIDYEVNPSLIGGLQMYTENKFMDLSLSSRVDRIKDEISRLV